MDEGPMTTPHTYSFTVVAADAVQMTTEAHKAAAAYWGERRYRMSIAASPVAFSPADAGPAHGFGYEGNVTTWERET